MVTKPARASVWRLRRSIVYRSQSTTWRWAPARRDALLTSNVSMPGAGPPWPWLPRRQPREAHVPAQQPPPRQAPRLSPPDVGSRRPRVVRARRLKGRKRLGERPGPVECRPPCRAPPPLRRARGSGGSPTAVRSRRCATGAAARRGPLTVTWLPPPRRAPPPRAGFAIGRRPAVRSCATGSDAVCVPRPGSCQARGACPPAPTCSGGGPGGRDALVRARRASRPPSTRSGREPRRPTAPRRGARLPPPRRRATLALPVRPDAAPPTPSRPWSATAPPRHAGSPSGGWPVPPLGRPRLGPCP